MNQPARSKVTSAQRVGVKFNDRDAFGKFSVALYEDHVPFSHSGFQTVVLSPVDLEQLPAESGRLYAKFQADKFVEVFPITSTGKRSLVSHHEAKRLVRKFAQEL